MIRFLDFNEYAKYLLADKPIDPEWSSSYLGSVAAFLGACAPPHLWSKAPSGIFGATARRTKLERTMAAQPNVELLRRMGLSKKTGPEPYGKDLKIWASVRDAMMWIWGSDKVTWSEVRWMMEEAPLPLLAICELSCSAFGSMRRKHAERDVT